MSRSRRTHAREENEVEMGSADSASFKARATQLAVQGAVLCLLLSCTEATQPPSQVSASEPSEGEQANQARSEAEQRVDPAREALMDSIRRSDVADERVIQAMSRVPREAFIPGAASVFAYEDRALPIGHEQTISQPSLVAQMTSLLQVGPESKVLEIGTGSGYQAAILAELTKHVYSIEIVPELGEWARGVLESLGYEIHLRIGDGYRGWPEAAPFDAIVVTAAPDHIPPALIEQLSNGGRMVIPVGPVDRVQRLLLIEKDAAGKLRRDQRRERALRADDGRGGGERGQTGLNGIRL